MTLFGLGRKGRIVFHVALAVLGGGGLLSFCLLYDRVSPMASVDLKASRGEALEIARAHFEGRGFDLTGYQSAVVFDTDMMASIYLERTLGLSEANELMRTTVPTRYWRVRWFRPLQKEEFVAWVLPSGKLLGFDHIVPEDAPGSSLSQDEAREIAVRFLKDEQRVDLDRYELQAPSTDEKENRADHTFTWQDREFDVRGARLRLSVGVCGKEVAHYKSSWLKVPEEFTRRFRGERSRAWLLGNVARVFRMGLVISSLLVLIWMYKHRTVRPRQLAYVAAVILLLTLASELNRLPIIMSYYPTSERMGTFLFNVLASVLQRALMSLSLLVIAGLAGDALARELWGRKRKIIAPSRDLSTSVAISASRGVLLGFLGLGYVTFFYLLAKSLGAWTPLRAPYSNMLGTKLPFLYPLLVGARPAVSEEALFRLFSISFLLLVTKRKTLALIVPAVIWAFLHSMYLTSPTYLRGVELTVVGLVYGYVFLEFDLLTLIIAHYCYNAVLTSMPLLRSDNPYHFASGLLAVALVAVAIVPGAYRAFKRWRTGAPEEPAARVSACTLEDLEGHDDFWRAVARRLTDAAGIEDILERLRHGLEAARAEPTAVLVAKAKGQPIGYAEGRVETRSAPTGETKTGIVVDVFVAEGSRRMSIGSMLCSELDAWMRNHGVEAVHVRARMTDAAARPFWLAQGFKPSAEILQRIM